LRSVHCQVVDVAGMPGEAEHVQIVLDAGLSGLSSPTLSLTFAPLTPKRLVVHNDGSPRRHGAAVLGEPIPTTAFRLSLVGHVNCSHTTRYSPSGGGWHPDPLFPVADSSEVTVQGNVTNSLFVRVDIPRSAPSGTYEGAWEVSIGGSSFSIPVTLDVWSTALPQPADMYKAFGEIWSFTTNAFTGADTTNATTIKYLDMMSDNLLPPDSLYKSHPYDDFGMYKYLNSTGKVRSTAVVVTC
jgi:hypothetical protein